MKKLILCSLFLATALLSFSQSQRFILFEEFTQASCGPCAQQNPAFDALLNSNATKCTSIKYHTNWPGYDPMNLQNPADVAARVSYYGVTGVPYACMDGTPIAGGNYLGAPANLSQAKIDAEYAIPSTFNLWMNHQVSPGNDSIYVTMLGECTEAVSGNLVGQIGVIEKHIHFASPPGTNGEKDFYNVMKKMLPTASGTALASSFEVGDYFIIQGSWLLANVYTLSELSSVGFIQINGSKSIQQGANSSTAPLTMLHDNDVELMAASNYSTTNCSGTISPQINVRNNGNHAVTSLTVKYYVNSGAPASFTWNGNLATLKETVISLPAYTFAPEASNTLHIYTDLVNDVTDEYPKNDSTSAIIASAPATTNYALFELRTDKAPQETTWDLKNSSGTVIDSGGPYALPSHGYVDTVHLAGGGCYTFTLYDAGGNGICCSNGSGGYQLKTSTGVLIKQGGSFGSSEFVELKMDFPAAIEQFEKGSMKVYPNPFSGEARVTFYLLNPENVVLNLYNSTGQLVKSVNKGTFAAGDQECTIDAGSLPSGIYMLKMQAGAQVHICKVSVSK
ncbi:MAG: T9SS type A sorting domain-containing protein [Bacteroidetes bacterium]|nr:T9SS type A sorting domain-containing protein [Bacteroidota bacterium]